MKNVIAGLGAMLAVGCQTYDFERVVPLAVSQESHVQDIAAKTLKPNVMLLVDTSGSMNDTVVSNGGTRLSNLKDAMQEFLSGDAKDLARFGLTSFPDSAGGSGSLLAPSTISVQLPPGTPNDVNTELSLENNATAVNVAIQAISATGGTPTAASLAFVADDPGLNLDDGRRDFILLLTDGLPNGNLSNANEICTCGAAGNCSQAQTDACGCTQPLASACSCSGASCTSGSAPLCRAGCLDADNTVGVIEQLHSQRKIDTIVIGFGDDLTNGPAASVLNRMAIAGGQRRDCRDVATACGMDQTCGSDKNCSTAFYQATDSVGLTKALNYIILAIKDNVCEQSLDDRPSDPRFISVIVDGVTLQECAQGAPCDTYTYDGDKKITLEGDTCTKLKNSTPQNPVNLAIRAVEKL